MLNKLIIKNYKCWVGKTTIEFSKCVNVIVGISSSGKSAIISSFKLLTKNKPNGFKYLSNSVDKNESVFVKGVFDNGSLSLTKNKDPKKNKYNIRNENHKLSLESFGQSLPEEVESFVNMNYLNYSGQFDDPFLISDSRTAFSKTINKIIGIEKVDKQLSLLATRINKSNKIIKSNNKTIEEKENKLKKYKDIDKVEKYIDKIYSLREKIKSQKEKIESIVSNVEKYNELKESIKKDFDIDEVQKCINKIKNIKEIKQDLLISIDHLYKYIKLKKDECRDSININLYELKIKLNKERVEINKKLELLQDLKNRNNFSITYERQIEEAKDKLKKYLLDMKKCPICYSNIDEKIAEEICSH